MLQEVWNLDCSYRIDIVHASDIRREIWYQWATLYQNRVGGEDVALDTSSLFEVYLYKYR